MGHFLEALFFLDLLALMQTAQLDEFTDFDILFVLLEFEQDIL